MFIDMLSQPDLQQFDFSSVEAGERDSATVCLLLSSVLVD